MRPRVLVVDDKDTIVSLLRTVLQGTCDVTSSPDGRQALSLALAGDFDVVVTDARMPGLDGSPLLQELRSAKPDVDVVLMAVFPSLEKTVEALRAGGTQKALRGFERLSYAEAMDVARERASREYLLALMQEFNGSVSRAAERAGVERESLHRLLKRYGVRSTEFRTV
jgi:DNA-binding NtrC family response regulator